MDKPLKQRLIGALVLIALLSLVLPLFFNEPPDNKIEVIQAIPAVPDFDPIVVADPQPVADIPTDIPLQEMYQLQETPSSTIKADQTGVLSPEPSAIPHENTGETGRAVKTPDDAVNVNTQVKTTEKPVLAANGTPVSWVVQVISYSDAEAANKLKKQLQVQGYPAFTRTAEIKGKSLTRVFIGPKLQKTKAEKIKAVIDKQYKVKSLVVEFKPD
ncbi:MAG: SPOR domain-containing protein [Pseudomonadales bacterium]|nr:SPOR domain-containing protein [Pseudomonadales bacterium]